MEKKPIEGVMRTAMESIRDMIDVSTVIGEPVISQEGSTVVPVSRVSFGFAAGGADCAAGNSADLADPFAGGAGAGVSVQPVGFLVMEQGRVRLLPAQFATPVDRLIELAPQFVEDLRTYLREKSEKGVQNSAAMAEREGERA